MIKNNKNFALILIACLFFQSCSSNKSFSSKSKKSKSSSSQTSKDTSFFSKANYYMIMGNFYFKMDKYLKALEYYRLAIKQDPNLKNVANKKIQDCLRKLNPVKIPSF